MAVEILNALVELVKQGGTIALWGIGIWLTLTGFKVCLVVWAVWLMVYKVCNLCLNYLMLRFISNKDKVSLISEQASQTILQSLKCYQDETSSSMKDLLEHVKDLMKKPEDGEKKK